MFDAFFPAIETERLVLRPLALCDSEPLLSIFSDAEVMKYWNTPPWTSIQNAVDFINDSKDSMQRQASLTLGIYLKTTDELVGKCMLFN